MLEITVAPGDAAAPNRELYRNGPFTIIFGKSCRVSVEYPPTGIIHVVCVPMGPNMYQPLAAQFTKIMFEVWKTLCATRQLVRVSTAGIAQHQVPLTLFWKSLADAPARPSLLCVYLKNISDMTVMLNNAFGVPSRVATFEFHDRQMVGIPWRHFVKGADVYTCSIAARVLLDLGEFDAHLATGTLHYPTEEDCIREFKRKLDTDAMVAFLGW